MFTLNKEEDDLITMSFSLKTLKHRIYHPSHFRHDQGCVLTVSLGTFCRYVGDGAVDLSKICGLVDNMNIENDRLDVQWKLLDTPTSKLVKQLGTENLRIAPTGTGTVVDGVVSDYSLCGFNLFGKLGNE